MDNDPQHLIALSLTKIAMARNQRCGLNLHKNLLVTSVLHKARTIFTTESLNISAVNNSMNLNEVDSLCITSTDKVLSDIEMGKENLPPVVHKQKEQISIDTSVDAVDSNSVLQPKLNICSSDIELFSDHLSTAPCSDVSVPLSPGKSALKRRLLRQNSTNHEPIKQCRLNSHLLTNNIEEMTSEPQLTIMSLFNSDLSGLYSDSPMSCSTEAELADLSAQMCDLNLPMTTVIAV